MDELSGRDLDRQGAQGQGHQRIRSRPAGLGDATGHYLPGVQDPRQRVASGQRPWVGWRFLRALLIALPLAAGMWFIIGWAIQQLFF